jgi:hypothetical protein
MLAGCYFRANDFPLFVRHAAKSLWLTPSSAKYFAAFPARLLRRAAGRSRNSEATRGERGED